MILRAYGGAENWRGAMEKWIAVSYRESSLVSD